VFIHPFHYVAQMTFSKIAWPTALLAWAMLLCAWTNAHYSIVANLFLFVIQWKSYCWTQCVPTLKWSDVDNCILTYFCPKSAAHAKTTLWPTGWETLVYWFRRACQKWGDVPALWQCHRSCLPSSPWAFFLWNLLICWENTRFAPLVNLGANKVITLS